MQEAVCNRNSLVSGAAVGGLMHQPSDDAVNSLVEVLQSTYVESADDVIRSLRGMYLRERHLAVVASFLKDNRSITCDTPPLK